MSSSVLGLGAASLGAAALGSPKFKTDKPKKTSAPQASAQDFLNSYMSLIWGEYKGSEKEKISATFGGPLKSASSGIYYREAPSKLPQGSVVVRGQDVNVQMRGKNEGSYTKAIPTYQVLQTQPKQLEQQQPQLKLDLGQGGKKNKFNTKDINYALEQGASRKEIKQAVKSQDIQMSAKAKSALFKEKKKKN